MSWINEQINKTLHLNSRARFWIIFIFIYSQFQNFLFLLSLEINRMVRIIWKLKVKLLVNQNMYRLCYLGKNAFHCDLLMMDLISCRPSEQRRSESSVNMAPVMVHPSEKPSKRWKSHSTLNICALSVER